MLIFTILGACTREYPTAPPEDTDQVTDTDTDTDSDPPGACVTPPNGICLSDAVQADGAGTYSPPDGGHWFCLSSLTLAEGCDEYISSYPEPGCPPIDWEGYGSWDSYRFTPMGRTVVRKSRSLRIDGNWVDRWMYYEDRIPTLLILDRYCSPEALWCCGDGEGGRAVQLLFGDASLRYRCVSELPP